MAHILRQIEGCRISAHLLAPGFTYTGMISGRVPQKPAGAWDAEQVADTLFDRLATGAFYVWCADNETPAALDHMRILWSAGDIIENRPALSRWHPDHVNRFEEYCRDLAEIDSYS